MFCIWMILLLRYSIVFFIQLSRTHIKAGCVRGTKADDKFSSGSRVFHGSSHICRSTSDRSLTDPSVRLPAHSGKCASNQTFAAACRRLQQRAYMGGCKSLSLFVVLSLTELHRCRLLWFLQYHPEIQNVHLWHDNNHPW